MPFTTYDELKTAATDFMKRAGQIGQASDWVTLAEAQLNRKIGPVEINASRTGTVDSRSIDISALSINDPVALWVSYPDSEDEVLVQMQAPGTLAYIQSSGPPAQWCMDSDSSIKLDRPCDMAYAFRFRFRQRFALSDTSPTNWLLENHPDVYLAAVMLWGAGYNEAWANGQVWKQQLAEGIAEVSSTIAQANRGTLRVDPALSSIWGRRRTYLELVNGG